jgi:hypothetical protein
VAQFGEPNIHVAYDGGRFEQVFIRRVVERGARREAALLLCWLSPLREADATAARHCRSFRAGYALADQLPY